MIRINMQLGYVDILCIDVSRCTVIRNENVLHFNEVSVSSSLKLWPLIDE